MIISYNFNIPDMEKAIMGDPTETALVKVFFKEVKEIEEFFNDVERVYEIPFDSKKNDDCNS